MANMSELYHLLIQRSFTTIQTFIQHCSNDMLIMSSFVLMEGSKKECLTRVLDLTSFYNQLKRDKLKFPTNDKNDQCLIFVIIGYERFALHKHILKPNSQETLTHEK
jgi:hypothetical protein